ncbi:lysylphosphatidylglycerol synthase transmembrane domain-containing protein [Acidithrix sp. C25]|uniref:lysylphosphatidylglycerol synthase transmembrane domain-containing protein n=1 Tax=Acidithrix sp. C25 TaxID=1671482 RepID=UPI00191BAD32|nr:lysylphosphatidylglycerol synthase transmembrane domain-containing protein [Acidithrix sp. C25]CAG4918816.1 unnamed protein product [Acidithrix sp. C25]
MGEDHLEGKNSAVSTISQTSIKRAFPYLRYVSTLVMFYVLVTKVDWTRIEQIGRRGFSLIAFAFVVTLVGIAVSVVRWHRVLAALDVKSRFRDLIELQLAGMFAGNFLPSTVGGDVIRAKWLGSVSKASSDSVASVVLERLTGWLVLPLLVLFGVASDPSMLQLGSVSQMIMVIAFVTLVALFVLVRLSILKWQFPVASKLRFLNGVMSSISKGLGRFRENPTEFLRLIGWAFLYQICVVAASIFAASALSISIGWRALFVLVPTIAMLQVLPLTIGGLGVREGALVLMLHPLGIRSAPAIEFGLLVYAINIAASLFGAPSFAMGSKRLVQRRADNP